MRGLRHLRTGLAQALAAFALLAMVVRALVPAGYMVAAADDGRFLTITLCSSHGGREAVLDLKTGALLDADAAPDDQAPADAPKSDTPCVFATAAALSAPQTPEAFVAPFQIASVDQPQTRAAAPGRGLVAPPFWSKGPPAAA